MLTTKVKCLDSGAEYLLDDNLFLGSGSEGDIYGVPGKDDLAIKIYKPKLINEPRAAKLRAMLANPPDDRMRKKKHASIAWPMDLVSNGNGRICGFVMPRLRGGHQISQIFDVDFRKTNLPTFTYRSLCTMAGNLVSAVWAIHNAGCVIADVNDGNIMGIANGYVTIVDTDSFQITEPGSGYVHYCPVGTPFFTPPEFQYLFDIAPQGKKPPPKQRSPEQDMFGIATLVFRLLMEGHFPYACAFPDSVDPLEYVDCLKQGLFPHGPQARFGPADLAPPFAMLHPSLRELFVQCFVAGNTDPQARPSAGTWHRALKDSLKDLTRCAANSQHYYFNHCPACPWCEWVERLNRIKPDDWDPFPAPSAVHQPSAGTQPGTQQPISVSTPPRPAAPPPSPWAAPPRPAPPPSVPATPPAVFTASATTVAPGQPITFQWTVPNASSVQLQEKSGRALFTSNSPSGVVQIYPTRNTTYQLSASGPNVSLPSPITISVSQPPTPITLNAVEIELNTPTPLQSEQLELWLTSPLKEVSLGLRSPLALVDYLRLVGYGKLNGITVDLNHPQPPTQGAGLIGPGVGGFGGPPSAAA